MAQTTGGPVGAASAYARPGNLDPGASRSRPGELVGNWLRSELRTTPGRLRLWSIVVLVLTAVTATLGVNALGARRRVASELRNDRAVLLLDAQALHTALLRADAAAANAFLAGGRETGSKSAGCIDATTKKQKTLYQCAIDDAATSLSAVARRADTGATGAVPKLSALLPGYAGLIESARANNRQGFPAGGAYLRAASSKLRTEMVPLVEDVEQGALARFKNRYNDLAGGPAVFLVGLLIVLLALFVLLQVALLRRTNRLLNLPLAAATVVLLVLLVATLSAMSGQRSDARDAVRQGFRPALFAADARVQGFTAKADESLALVARGNDDAFKAEFIGASDATQTRLRKLDVPEQFLVTEAGTAFEQFRARHDALEALADTGDYGGAVRAATSEAKDSANAAFTQFDDVLNQLRDVTNSRFLDRMRAAGNRMSVLRWLLPLVVILAGALALAGLQTRINEFR